ncbi:MAG: S1 RNA-binding domain-containing protein [Elusimicrobia bacterium]|nr:S1 RNA-binding domain-containing protein [Elusimicrobiota bacterium]
MTDDTQEREETQEAEGETMEALLKEHTDFQEKLAKRDVVWVKVILVKAENVLVDIGERNEAVIPLSEFPSDEQPTVGRRIPAVLVKRGRGEQPTQMSIEKARWTLGWEGVVKAHAEKQRVKGKVKGAVKGGFLVDVGGVTGFMPASLADLRPVRKPEILVNTGVRCYIVELDKGKGQMILSRRAVLEEDASKRRDKILGELSAGMIRIGRVTRVAEAGVFVDVGGVEGLAANEDLAWQGSGEAKKKLERGAKLRVKVLKVEAGKIALGLKQLTAHPADALRKKYAVKAVVQGTVSEILKDGVRVKLSKGDAAFCPVRELPTEGGDPTRGRADRYEGGGARGGGGGARGAGGAGGRDRDSLPPIWPKVGDAVGGIVLGISHTALEVTMSIRRFDAIQDRKQVAKYMRSAPPLTLGQLLNPDAE